MERLEWTKNFVAVVVHRMDPLLWIRSTGWTSQRYPQNLHTTVIFRLAEPRFIRTFAEGRQFSGSEFSQRISNTVYGYIQD